MEGLTSLDALSIGAERIAGSKQIRGEFIYESRIPSLFNWMCFKKDLSHFVFDRFNRRDVVCPPEYGFHLKRCFVVSGKYVVFSDGVFLSETLADAQFNDVTKNSLAQWTAEGRRSDYASLIPSDRTFVHIAKEGAGNYGHLFTEILPKLVNLKEYSDGRFVVLFPPESKGMSGLIDLVIANLGVDAISLFVDDGSILYFDELIWLGPVSKYPIRKSKALMELVTSMKSALLTAEGTEQKSRRLFITRSNSEKRSIANMADLEPVLTDHGYELFQPAQFSLQEQVKVFNEASMVVGPLGAGLTNILFSPKATRIGMIDPALCDYFYWDLANFCEQPFYWLFTDEYDGYSPQKLLSSFNVDLKELGSFLRRMES